MPFHGRQEILEEGDDPVQDPNTIRTEKFNLATISSICGDKMRAIKWLVQKGLLKNKMRCPGSRGVYCGMWMNLVRRMGNNSHPPSRTTGARAKFTDPLFWRCAHCRRNGVQVKRSIRERSFFSKSHLGFGQAILLIYHWSTHPTSNRHEVMRETGIREAKTVTDWFNFLREICQEWALDPANQVQLGGPGIVVEVDESKLYKAKYNRGRGLNRRHQWVFGLIERGSHRCVVVPVDRRDQQTLLPIIAQWILPGSIIVTDSWAAYGGIGAMQQNYTHWTVNHRYNFVNPTNPLAHTQGIESMWSNLKRQLHHLQGTSDALFQSYLYQYMFRRAMHHNDNLFGDILFHIGQYNPL